MTDNDFITQLIEELAELFPLRDDIIVVARESGLSPQHIKMDGRGATIWSEVLEEAKKQAKLLELVIVALRHFPNRQILIQAKVRLEQPAPKPETTSQVPAQLQWPSNPFTDTLWVARERFVGREANLRRLRQVLGTASLHLQGTAKIGKSSLLRYMYQEQLESSQKAVFGSLEDQSFEDVIEEVAELLGLASGVKWTQLRRAIVSQPFYLFLDELDYAPQMGLTLEWGRRLRGLAGGNFRLITAARRLPGEILPHTEAGSDWYNFLSPETLNSLDEMDAEKLLTSRLPLAVAEQIFPAEKCHQLIILSQGHPFKLMRAAFRYYDQQTNESNLDWQAEYYNDLKHFSVE